MNYGNAIRTIRTLKGISQVDLSGSSKLSKSYLSKIESGAQIPSIESLEQIAKALDVPVYALAFFASEKKDLKSISIKESDELKSHLFDMILAINK
jgi:transcriptional regulator with XRE-family HTH domain